MSHRSGKLIMLLAFTGLASIGTARADCEADMAQLDQAAKGSAFTAKAKTILEDARKKAIEAVKKDDDETCNKVITDAMMRAGVKK
ncbi:hypothetical protein SAMN05519103_07787 [Rhizobiales bacterium GAS113]|nr:hypothetical protein SAMN05519103_07787 [Rhizobiales bacterium GAS113]